jgi:hypothetical protein
MNWRRLIASVLAIIVLFAGTVLLSKCLNYGRDTICQQAAKKLDLPYSKGNFEFTEGSNTIYCFFREDGELQRYIILNGRTPQRVD